MPLNLNKNQLIILGIVTLGLGILIYFIINKNSNNSTSSNPTAYEKAVSTAIINKENAKNNIAFIDNFNKSISDKNSAWDNLFVGRSANDTAKRNKVVQYTQEWARLSKDGNPISKNIGFTDVPDPEALVVKSAIINDLGQNAFDVIRDYVDRNEESYVYHLGLGTIIKADSLLTSGWGVVTMPIEDARSLMVSAQDYWDRVSKLQRNDLETIGNALMIREFAERYNTIAEETQLTDKEEKKLLRSNKAKMVISKVLAVNGQVLDRISNLDPNGQNEKALTTMLSTAFTGASAAVGAAMPYVAAAKAGAQILSKISQAGSRFLASRVKDDPQWPIIPQSFINDAVSVYSNYFDNFSKNLPLYNSEDISNATGIEMEKIQVAI